jgi:hypothetical protein
MSGEVDLLSTTRRVSAGWIDNRGDVIQATAGWEM